MALCLPAFAQSEHEERVVQRETAAEKTAVAVAAKARQKKSLETLEKVTFQQILQHPADAEMNFRYARQQVSQDDLLGAAGTLERILIKRPNLHEVRLFYAVVLYRLDNVIEAERELTTLEQQKIPAVLASEVKAYKKAISLRKKKTRLSLAESVGFEFDTNRNASPSSKQVLFMETPINTAGTTRRRDDTSFLNITSLSAVHDLGFQSGHQLIADFTYFQQEQTVADSLDLSSFQYDLGGVYKTRWVSFTPTFFASHTFLSRENYINSQGGNFQFDRKLTDRLDVEMVYRLEHQNFLPITENNAANDRDGYENSVSGGFSYTLSANMRVGSGLVYSNKNARQDFQDYNRILLRNYHIWLLGKGQFLLNSLDTNFDRYQTPDVAVAGRHRHDQMIRYRATYGAPLTTLLIGKILPRPLKDITATVTFEYFHAHSNITNYSYTNYKYQAMLTKKWDF